MYVKNQKKKVFITESCEEVIVRIRMIAAILSSNESICKSTKCTRVVFEL